MLNQTRWRSLCGTKKKLVMKSNMFERAKATAAAAHSRAQQDPNLARMANQAGDALNKVGALVSETKKKVEEHRGAIMQSTFERLEPKLADFMQNVYATKIKPELTTDKWSAPHAGRSNSGDGDLGCLGSVARPQYFAWRLRPSWRRQAFSSSVHSDSALLGMDARLRSIALRTHACAQGGQTYG